MSNEKIVRLDEARSAAPNRGGGKGEGTDQRLRAVEASLTGLNQKVDEMKGHMATKADIANVKVWVLSGVLGAAGITATITTIIVKGFFS